MGIIWTKYLLDEVMASELPWSYVVGEVKELRDELVKRDFDEAKKEFEDVVGCTFVYLTGITGVNLPLVRHFGKGAAERWIARINVWKDIFNFHGVVFHKSVLTGGGNYRKRHKVEAALRKGGYNDEIKWDTLEVMIDFE